MTKQKTPTPTPKLRPMSPAKARTELKELEWLYEHSGLTTAAYDAARARILRALEEWGKQ